MTDVQPDYFAIPDPLDDRWLDPDWLGTTRLSYWYRPKRGKKAGQLQPWPPRRNRWGRLTWAEVNAQPLDQREDFQIQHWAKVRAGRQEVARRIDADPELAAARFAEARSICCCCGKGLTDERSKAYGIGPDCRQGIDPQVLTALIAKMAEVHAAGRVSWRQNSKDDPQLFAS